MRQFKVDMWHGHTIEDADKIDISWSDCDCCYRGNIYKAGKMIGDYWAANFEALEKAFPNFNFKWEG